ncbi:RNA polymerase sigma factor [Tahibacter amnicola]|uniref:RNA polymerase sigma factor n=1 Tax=Tahibacter amnicola TaxID=2976241 RepID=A0ABY6BGC0_9GAMM|nr:RNA polymerase sigma factor [Tahibacter amnicola]UXI68880.1 RNA polymerase sigma factor [Tahibacter amnicola]
MTNEDEWVAAARNGDRVAFRRLVDAHARTFHALAARITRDATLAEDAVQEALWNAWRHLRDFDGRARFSTWMHRIVVNAALEQLRRRGDREDNLAGLLEDDDEEAAFLARHADETPGPDLHADGHEIRVRVETQLARMSALERSAFVLRHHEGHSLEEICGVLSINVSACKQAIFRAVKKLRLALDTVR